MALVLHTASHNKFAAKTLIVAEYCGIEVQVAENFKMGVSNKTPEFLKMSPLGKVPVLETPDGPVFESNAIARYLTKLKSDHSLYGSSLIDYAHIEQWMDFSVTEIDANIGSWLYPRLGYLPYIAPAEEAAVAALKTALGALDTHLASRTYLVGDSVTLADIVMGCNLSIGFRMIMTKSFSSEFPHVERYYFAMVNQPNFKKIIGEATQAESVPPIASPKPKAKEEPKATGGK